MMQIFRKVDTWVIIVLSVAVITEGVYLYSVYGYLHQLFGGVNSLIAGSLPVTKVDNKDVPIWQQVISQLNALNTKVTNLEKNVPK